MAKDYHTTKWKKILIPLQIHVEKDYKFNIDG